MSSEIAAKTVAMEGPALCRLYQVSQYIGKRTQFVNGIAESREALPLAQYRLAKYLEALQLCAELSIHVFVRQYPGHEYILPDV